MTVALIAEAARRSRVCWLSYQPADGPGTAAVRDRLVWHTWYDEALVVLSCREAEQGVSEQHLPGVESAARVEVTLRSKDTGGRLVTWTGAVDLVEPGTESWDQHVEALLGVRLNLRDPQASRRSWAEHGTVVRITPLPAPADEARDGVGRALP